MTVVSTQIEPELSEEERAKYLQRTKRQTAFHVLQSIRNRWPAELQPMFNSPPNWSQRQRLVAHRASALVVVPGNTMNSVLWSWFSFQSVTKIEQVPYLSAGLCGVSLPKVQITSSKALVRMTFSGEKTNKPPYDWVDKKSDLVAVWLDSGAAKHEASINGLIDLINACEMHSVPLWIGCSHKWRYGSKHALHHERIDEWVDSVPAFETGEGGGLCA